MIKQTTIVVIGGLRVKKLRLILIESDTNANANTCTGVAKIALPGLLMTLYDH